MWYVKAYYGPASFPTTKNTPSDISSSLHLKGIGRAIALALALANSGTNLALLDLHPSDLEETQRLCSQAYPTIKVEIYTCDITSPTTVHKTFTTLNQLLGPVDILVNNAGIALPTSIFSDPEDSFTTFWPAVDVNFKGTMLCAFQVLKSMRDRKSGVVINLASRAATIDMAGGMGYSMSKAAVARATHGLQEEFEAVGLGEQVQWFCLHPGGFGGRWLLVSLPHSRFFHLPSLPTRLSY